MPTDITDNAGNHSATTGTGPIVLGAALKYNRSIADVLSDADVRTFFAIDAAGTDYMLFVGTYTASGTSVSVDVVKHSSNSDAAVNWSGGQIQIAIVASVDEIVGDTTEVSDLDAASPLDGTELLPGLQQGLARKFTPSLFNDRAITQQQGYDRNEIRHFTQFLNTSRTEIVSTDGALFGNEPVWCTIGGGTGQVRRDASTFSLIFGVANCRTGTNALGRAGVISNIWPCFPTTTSSKTRIGVVAGLSAVPTGAQDFYANIGWFNDPSTGNPTDGLFFQATSANANWQAISRLSSASSTTTNTGIAVTASTAVFANTYLTFEIYYDHNDGTVYFYINGAEVAAHADTVNFPDTDSTYIGAYIQKTAGTTSRELWVDCMEVDLGLTAGTGISTGTL